jgi:heptosyltransferase III
MSHRIIIFRPGQFGDTLVAFPAIQGISQAFPDAEIVYCSNKFRNATFVWAEEVARLSPFIKSTAIYFFEDPAFRKWKNLRHQILPRSGDILLYLPYAKINPIRILRDYLFFKSLGPWKTVGFSEAFNWYFKWKNLDRLGEPYPRECDRIWEVATSALSLSLPIPEVCSINKDEQWAENKLREWKINGKEILAVCPGSKMQSKRWPLDRFRAVGEAWHKKTGAALVIIGGPEEECFAEELMKEWKGYACSCCGANLLQTAGILSRSRAYFGNDTGSMHLAALMGIPCVAVFSSRANSGQWHPFGNKNVVLRSDVPCKHCMLQTCTDTTPKCLNTILEEHVLDGLNTIWT